MAGRLLSDEPFRPEVVSSETVFHGRVWDCLLYTSDAADEL